MNSLEEVRANIDRIDQQIVQLLGERQSFVREAAGFKKTTDNVKAPARAETVIAKVRNLSLQHHLDADIAEAVYRTIIDCFIKSEMNEFNTK